MGTFIDRQVAPWLGCHVIGCEASGLVRSEDGLDSLIGGGFSAVDAAGIDAEEHIDVTATS